MYDYGNWLRNQIVLQSLDPLIDTVFDLQPGNAFDHEFVCPKMYSTLGMGFRSFSVKSKSLPDGKQTIYNFVFNPKERLTVIEQRVLDMYEQDGSIVVGKASIGDCLVMDKNNILYLGTKGNLNQLGTFEQILGISTERAPKEFAELRVLGKNIPIGINLS